MANETIIAVPASVANPEQLRIFLQNLVTELDKQLGLRTDAIKEPISNFERRQRGRDPAALSLRELAISAQQRDSTIQDLDATLQDVVDKITAAAAASLTVYTAPTISATYEQTEVQALADRIQLINEAVRTLIAGLS